jgi:hemoglobin
MSHAMEKIGLDHDISEEIMKHFRVVANLLEIENRSNEKIRNAAGLSAAH